MHKLSVVVLSLLTAGSAHAQFNILSDNRSVNASGWVEDASGNVTQSFSQTQFPTTPDPFSGNAGGNATGLFYNNNIYSGSSASQNSFVTSTQLSYSASLEAFQSYPAPPGHLYSDASSLFAVNFSVSSETPFTLSINQHNWDYANVTESYSLSSSINGNLLTGPQLNPSGTEEYTGLLEPDQIYTFQVSLKTQDYYDPNVSQAFDAVLNAPEVIAAPEPSTTLLLGTGGVVAGLIGLRRKRLGLTKAVK